MHTRAALRRRPNSYPGTLLRDLRMFHEGERVRRGVKYAIVVNVSHPQRKFFLELEPRRVHVRSAPVAVRPGVVDSHCDTCHPPPGTHGHRRVQDARRHEPQGHAPLPHAVGLPPPPASS